MTFLYISNLFILKHCQGFNFFYLKQIHWYFIKNIMMLYYKLLITSFFSVVDIIWCSLFMGCTEFDTVDTPDFMF